MGKQSCSVVNDIHSYLHDSLILCKSIFSEEITFLLPNIVKFWQPFVVFFSRRTLQPQGCSSSIFMFVKDLMECSQVDDDSYWSGDSQAPASAWACKKSIDTPFQLQMVSLEISLTISLATCDILGKRWKYIAL